MRHSKMKAAICTAYGSVSNLKITDVSKPDPKSDEILVKVMAATVNSGDVRVRALDAGFMQRVMLRLLFGVIKLRNPVLGTVYSGVVERTGDEVREFKKGDQVYGLTGFKFGTHAEYILVKEKSVIAKKPVNASFNESAAIAFGGQTAAYFLQKTDVFKRPGLNVMIYGASGSVGTSAVQISRYYHATVTAVCSSENRDLVLKLGADAVIDYKKDDYTKSKTRFDVILDAVGKISKAECSHLLKKNGVFKTVDGMEYAKEHRWQLILLNELFEKGHLNAVIDKVFSLDEIAKAHEYVESGRKKGNVVLEISQDKG